MIKPIALQGLVEYAERSRSNEVQQNEVNVAHSIHFNRRSTSFSFHLVVRRDANLVSIRTFGRYPTDTQLASNEQNQRTHYLDVLSLNCGCNCSMHL
jgi:hypothetical protein